MITAQNAAPHKSAGKVIGRWHFEIDVFQLFALELHFGGPANVLYVFDFEGLAFPVGGQEHEELRTLRARQEARQFEGAFASRNV